MNFPTKNDSFITSGYRERCAREVGIDETKLLVKMKKNGGREEVGVKIGRLAVYEVKRRFTQ